MSTMLDAEYLEVAAPGYPLPAAALEPGYQESVLSLLLDELSHAVAIVTEHRQIVHLNEAARYELERCGVLYAYNGELQTLSPLDGHTLQDALGKAASGKRSLIKLAASGIGMTLSVVPLKRKDAGESCGIALFFARAGLDDSGMFSFFARSHGLTPTEEQVLVLLCRSLSTPEIAQQMRVAVSTVRSHVRSLCAKTVSSGVRELVNRVAVLPPVGPLPLIKLY